MATKTKSTKVRMDRLATVSHDQRGGMRRCKGSERYGIKPHDAPIADFPVQPSRKDGLGSMCKPHWTEYTRGLRRDQRAREDTAAFASAPSAAAAVEQAATRRTAIEAVLRWLGVADEWGE